MFSQTVVKSLEGMTLICILGASFLTPVQAQETPLQRLQQRSANERWREASEEWLPKGASVQSPEDFLRVPTGTVPPLNQLTETPVMDSKILEEKFKFLIPIPLFDVHPLDEVQDQSQHVQKPEDGMVAKPFPNSEELRVSVPDPYLDLSTRLVPTRVSPKISPIQPEKLKSDGTLKIARLDPVPPAASRQNQQPVLRSITEIQPFHNYVSAKHPQTPMTMQAPERMIAESVPEYQDLPPQGELTGSDVQTYFHWMASNLAHDPLYFEDVSLERYGHAYPAGVQPFVSISKFGLQAIGLPYQMALNPVDCEQYPLGYDRPGDVAPHLRYRIPFNGKAATTSAAVYTGLFFLIP